MSGEKPMGPSANPENVLLSSMPADNGELRVFLWDGKILLEGATGQQMAPDRRSVTIELSHRTAGVLVAILQIGMGALARKAIEAGIRDAGLIP